MTKPSALLLYSGGIDSVQALYARAKAGLPTRVHHVVLENWERRAPLERAAVRATLAWIEKRYPGMVDYTESGFNYGDLRYIVRDHNIWGLMAGIILANPKNEHITQLVRTFHRDSVRGGIDSKAGQRAEAAWSAHLPDREIEFIYPQRDMTKGDLMAALPKDLLALTWYCRRPRGGRPCHECHTCKQVDAVVAGEPLEPLDGKAEPAPADWTGPATIVADDPPAATEVKRPNKAKSRAEWAAYAESIGIDIEGLTKAQIIAAVEAL